MYICDNFFLRSCPVFCIELNCLLWSPPGGQAPQAFQYWQGVTQAPLLKELPLREKWKHSPLPNSTCRDGSSLSSQCQCPGLFFKHSDDPLSTY